LTGWRTGSPNSALSGFNVSLDQFEGPFDLLLHLIEKDGMDITSVSVLAVTAQYVQAVDLLSASYNDATSEFISLAANLLLLKSRALLPSTDMEDEDDDDDADDLAARLREYRTVRIMANELSQMQLKNGSSFIRIAEPKLGSYTAVSKSGTIEQLTQALTAMITRLNSPPPTIVTPVPRFNLKARIETLRKQIVIANDLRFAALAADCTSTLELVYTFLAVLHLASNGDIRLKQKKGFGPIQIESADN